MTSCTIQDFCKELAAKTEREGTKWKLSGIGRLRTVSSRPDCPLAYVTDERMAYEGAALMRGLTRGEINIVEDAADYPDTKYPEVRAQLLAATEVA